MRKFDYSFLNNGMLPASLVNLTSSIAELKTMAGVRKEEYTQIFTELEAVAKVLVNVQMFANRTGEVWFNMEDVRKDEDEE